MFFVLSKTLHYLLTPVLWIVALIIIALIVKKEKVKIRLFISAGILLLVFSNSFIQDEFMRWWEIDTTHKTELKTSYDYGIVLTGMISYDTKYERINFLRSTDRILQALDLYKDGTIKKIFITGGSGELLNPNFSEAEILRDYLIKIGIPENDILIESKSRNTFENACASAKLLNPQSDNETYLLITSAFHMRRSAACFKKAGFDFDVYVTDRYAGDRKFTIDHLIVPNIHALSRWTLLIHEVSGYIIYRIMGYC
jgi:uncharacterized SAM-binding protein YcdF (DUF218 family)